jgi:capsular polysaccharide export protein
LTDAQPSRSIRKADVNLHRFSPAVLLTPAFRADAPWVSGTLSSSAHGKTSLPGWRERALAAPIAADIQSEALALAARLVREELGGAFWAPSPPCRLPARAILVHAQGHDAGDTALLSAAREGGAARVVLLLPRPNFELAKTARAHGCTVLGGVFNPWDLFAEADAVFAAADSPFAVLARLAGLLVHSHTRQAGTPHVTGATAGEYAAASLLVGARYADPFTRRLIDCNAALDIIAEWRRVTRANRGIGVVTGMSFWKRKRISAFLHDGETTPPHYRSLRTTLGAASGRAIAAWSSRMPRQLPAFAKYAGIRVLRVEDGFLRSRGLGSDFRLPCSIIVDRAGIYYDPATPSDLEILLAETEFSAALLERAARLIERLRRDGTTKYGTSTGSLLLPARDGRRRLLVPGQVADDLSVMRGGAGIQGNAELLARVRAQNPDAVLIYKPHPDVEAGHRKGVLGDDEVLRYANFIVQGAPMAPLIEAVDEVHTLTSLSGFEALLRARRVVVYGQPFYAGWGLTEDLVPLPRRGRALSLEALVAAVLLLYPRYIDPVTELPCTAETALDRIIDPRLWRSTALIRLRQAQGRALAKVATWRRNASRSKWGSGAMSL